MGRSNNKAFGPYGSVENVLYTKRPAPLRVDPEAPEAWEKISKCDTQMLRLWYILPTFDLHYTSHLWIYVWYSYYIRLIFTVHV